MPSTIDYVIDAAHGADDVAVCDWNTRIQTEAISFGYDPAAPGLKFCAPATTVLDGLDNTTTRAGVLFRAISIPVGGSVLSAKLKLYLNDWQPNGWVDPISLLAGLDAYPIHVNGAMVFAPAPGFNECPGPSAPGWGNLPANPILTSGTGVTQDGMVAGAGGPTGWGSPHEKPGWPGGTRNWYPSRFDALSGPTTTGTGSSETEEIGLRTLATAAVSVGKTTGYVEWDVTAIVQEILAHNFAAPAWTAKTYSLSRNFFPAPFFIPQVLAPNGYVYTFVGNGVSFHNGYWSWPRGQSGLSNTAPSQTVIGGEEQPDGPGTAIWRCAQNGQIRNWQSGDNIAFVLLVRPPGTPATLSAFPEAHVPGWRTFTSGDANIPAQAPTLTVTTLAAGEFAVPSIPTNLVAVSPTVRTGLTFDVPAVASNLVATAPKLTITDKFIPPGANFQLVAPPPSLTFVTNYQVPAVPMDLVAVPPAADIVGSLAPTLGISVWDGTQWVARTLKRYVGGSFH